jgi:hypothetical protein
VFSLWAEAFGSELIEIDHPGASDLPRDGGKWVVAAGENSLNRIVSRLSRRRCNDWSSGWRQSADGDWKLRHCGNGWKKSISRREVFDAVRQLIASAPEAPVRMTEQITT